MLSNPNAVVRRRKDSTGSELVRRRLIAVVDTLLYTAKVVFFGIFLIAEYIFLSLECMYSCSLIMRPAFEKRLRICLGLSKYHNQRKPPSITRAICLLLYQNQRKPPSITRAILHTRRASVVAAVVLPAA